MKERNQQQKTSRSFLINCYPLCLTMSFICCVFHTFLRIDWNEITNTKHWTPLPGWSVPCLKMHPLMNLPGKKETELLIQGNLREKRERTIGVWNVKDGGGGNGNAKSIVRRLHSLTNKFFKWKGSNHNFPWYFRIRCVEIVQQKHLKLLRVFCKKGGKLPDLQALSFRKTLPRDYGAQFKLFD